MPELMSVTSDFLSQLAADCTFHLVSWCLTSVRAWSCPSWTHTPINLEGRAEQHKTVTTQLLDISRQVEAPHAWMTPERQTFALPEYVGVRQPVHELDLPEHVGSVAGQDVHLQSHDLTRHTMLHLDQNNTHTQCIMFHLHKSFKNTRGCMQQEDQACSAAFTRTLY